MNICCVLYQLSGKHDVICRACVVIYQRNGYAGDYLQGFAFESIQCSPETPCTALVILPSSGVIRAFLK
jgi:hypothetical protein